MLLLLMLPHSASLLPLDSHILWFSAFFLSTEDQKLAPYNNTRSLLRVDIIYQCSFLLFPIVIQKILTTYMKNNLGHQKLKAERESEFSCIYI